MTLEYVLKFPPLLLLNPRLRLFFFLKRNGGNSAKMLQLHHLLQYYENEHSYVLGKASKGVLMTVQQNQEKRCTISLDNLSPDG